MGVSSRTGHLGSFVSLVDAMRVVRKDVPEGVDEEVVPVLLGLLASALAGTRASPNRRTCRWAIEEHSACCRCQLFPTRQT